MISRVRDSTHVLDGLLYHESDLNITEHYTDTQVLQSIFFALMHLQGSAFAPRIRELHDNRRLIHGKAERYPGLQSVISTTSLNIKDIETYWDEVLRLAASIKQGTVTASLMMKKFLWQTLNSGSSGYGLIVIVITLTAIAIFQHLPCFITRVSIYSLSILTTTMSCKGCSPDHAACEVFFSRLKTEMYYGRKWSGITPEKFMQHVDHQMV